MRNILITAFIALSSFIGIAQQHPDRMVIHQASGNFKSYLPERIDSITFHKIEGRVAADVNILEISLEKLIVEITRTEACQGFKLSCLPKVLADRLNTDASLCDYIDKESTNVYYEDFTHGELSGIQFEPNTNYVLLTVGMDQFGTPCSVSKAPFTTPRKPLVGNPQVTISPTDIQQRSFTAHFEPNEDVSGFAVLAMEKGSLEQQFEMFGPMFGFSNIGDMVKAWGAKFMVAGDFTWKDMSPGTEYTIYAQAWDVADTYADLNSIDISTKTLGGSGVASVTIELADYKLMDWDGQQLPSQFIRFTPNDQASCFRFNVFLATNYNKDPEGIKSELCQDPPQPMANWFYYEPVQGEYQINTSTEVVAIAAAKNADGVWGPVNEFTFTTPATVGGVAAPVNKAAKFIIPQRIPNPTTNASQIGTMPIFKTKSILLNGK